jgi:hypothetical protein
MTFEVGTITRCVSGGSHYRVPVTIGGTEYILTTTAAEMQGLGPGTLEERREAILVRLRSAIAEGGVSGFTAIKNLLEGKSYQV